MKKILTLGILLACATAQAQYAPQAGIPGSTAIDAGSSQIVAWATGCTVNRGYLNIDTPSLGYATVGDSSAGTGTMDHAIVSLGDSGSAVLTFARAIYDGPGADFAIFENGFLNTANDTEAFLELAFVEVSSDGMNYFRFPAASLTQYNVQLGNGDYIDARKVNNMAGKYVSGYGTPFDLQELAGKPGLDVNHITHVRVVDAVGSVGAHASHDEAGRVVNDPYPTPFPSCGFDLDAVGVIHETAVGVHEVRSQAHVYPNPVRNELCISTGGTEVHVSLVSVTGAALSNGTVNGTMLLDMTAYPAGTYYLVTIDANGNRWAEVITKR